MRAGGVTPQIYMFLTAVLIGGAVAAFSGGPAAAFDQAVVGSAGQVEVVDVGGSALGPVGGGVVDLAAVAGHGAAREGTTAVAFV